MMKIFAALLALIFIVTIPQALVHEVSAHGHRCTKLKWCLDSYCPWEKDAAIASCDTIYRAAKAVCKAIPYPSLRRTCLSTAAFNHCVCKDRAKRDFKECQDKCCNDWYPKEDEDCIRLRYRCLRM